MKRFRVRFPAFDYVVEVVLTDDIAKVHARMSKENGWGDLPTPSAFNTHDLARSESLLVFDIEYAFPGTIAPESYHAIRRMFIARGIRADNELVAYHLEYLVNQISRRLHRLLYSGDL